MTCVEENLNNVCKDSWDLEVFGNGLTCGRIKFYWVVRFDEVEWNLNVSLEKI